MDWTIAIVTVAVIAGFFLLKRMAIVTEATARQHLADGALVIDVRSPEEFRSGHVQNAVNIPLGELPAKLPQHVKTKSHVLLLYCLSGGRSGIARHQIKGMGYPNVFNLGSYGRAQGILAGK